MFAILIFVLVLGVLVLVHEIGHFITALKLGCDVEEFGIGFPPRLFSFKKRGIRFSINLLPLGGYVKIKGEDGSNKNDPGSFASKPAWKKSLIVLAGVFMNVVLAYVLISITLVMGIPTFDPNPDEYGRFAKFSDEQIAIVQILEDSPASAAGVLPGDIVLSVDGTIIDTVAQLQATLSKQPPQEVSLEVLRDEEVKQFMITPAQIEGIDRLGIGVGLAETAVVSYPWYIAPLVGFTRTFEILWLILVAFKDLFVQFVTTATVGVDVAGPIGIAVITAQVADLGFVHLLQFTALLSLNLAIINILPFPALDGSRLVFIILEKIRGKKMQARFEKWIHIFGFGLLMLLMIVITIQDIQRYGASIWEGITSIFS